MKNRGQPRHVSEILMPRRRVAIDWDERFAQLRERTLEDQRCGRCGTDAEDLLCRFFNSDWRKACSVRKCSITEVDGFIKAHYLAKRPAIVLLCLVAERNGEPIGCIVYSAPPREADKRYGGKVWELARLYLLDEIPRNAETWLIGQSVKYIKRHHKDVRHLLSYADPSAGHAGTIYKAANWRQDGRTDDERKSPRCDYYDERTGKKYGRRGNMPQDAVVVRKPRVSKWRFTLAL